MTKKLDVCSFVHLRVHTDYSLLESICRIDRLVEIAKKYKMPAVAITDNGVMCGVPEFYRAAKRCGINPIIGCELDEMSGRIPGTPHNLVLLAANNEGYHNLIQLVSAIHLNRRNGTRSITLDLLARHHNGLIGLGAGLHKKGTLKTAIQAAGEYAEIFDHNNFYIELQDHGLPGERKVNTVLLEAARRTGLPLVATNDVQYLKKQNAEARDVLMCIKTKTTMGNLNCTRYASQEFYFKSGEEMKCLFREVPQALENTVKIAIRCNVVFNFKDGHVPIKVPSGDTPKSYLLKLCYAGIKNRYGITNPEKPADRQARLIMKRLHYEAGVIEKAGFLGNFLVIWDLVRFARENRIPVGPGRGSVGGSLVSYALGITSIDPLRYGLVFERFMNPERVSPPAFDIDFCQSRRGEVIDYAKEKYGRENVAQIVTFGSLGAKTVIREVGRVLQASLPVYDRLAKMVPNAIDITLEDALKLNPVLKKASESDPKAKKIMKYALVLDDLKHFTGLHPTGVVIGDQPLANLLPLTRDKSGEIVTQYSADHIEAFGLLKADFLGVKTLTVIDETLKLVQKTKGVSLNIQAIPMDDPATFDLLRRGDTVGVFQFESSGMRDQVRRIDLDKIEDIITLIALFRPGPMHMLEDYVVRRTGKVKITYADPRLEPILAETYGIMLYQEQVQQAAQQLAGYTLGQGDILRRVMGKRKLEEMEKQRYKFIKGCRKTCGMSAKKAGKAFDNIAKIAGYCFNKSHSTGYAIVAYQTAYLKAHYPEELMATLQFNEIDKTNKNPVLLHSKRKYGVCQSGRGK